VGDSYEYVDMQGGIVASGTPMIKGEVLESNPPRKLVTTFVPLWEDGLSHAPSRVTFEIEPRGTACMLTLTHDDMGTGHVQAGVISGWATILSGMKTLIETGEPLVMTQAM
jgi:uncharacterized protein YndB with AHSA1/START domain